MSPEVEDGEWAEQRSSPFGQIQLSIKEAAVLRQLPPLTPARVAGSRGWDQLPVTGIRGRYNLSVGKNWTKAKASIIFLSYGLLRPSLSI